MDVPIAVSTGWLFASGKDTMDEQAPFLRIVDGAELSVVSEDRVSTYDTRIQEEFQYLSFHIKPDMDDESIIELAELHNPETVVFHPNSFSRERVERLLVSGVPLAVENMDGTFETEGVTEDSLTSWFDEFPELGFVLDVQHAYEHDESMEYAKELVGSFGERLCEFHVSGGAEGLDHVRVCRADNDGAIRAFLQWYYDGESETPIVIEGQYESVSQFREEVNLLRSLV